MIALLQKIGHWRMNMPQMLWSGLCYFLDGARRQQTPSGELFEHRRCEFSESRTNQTCQTLHLGNTKQAGLHLRHIHSPYTTLNGVLTTLHVSHADHSQLTLLVVAAFAVYIFARICLPVSKLPAANSAHLYMAHFNTQNLNLQENLYESQR